MPDAADLNRLQPLLTAEIFLTTSAGVAWDHGVYSGVAVYQPAAPDPETQRAWEARQQAAREEARTAERRAYLLLEAAIGADAAAKVAAGGGYEIPSRRWRGQRAQRSYLVRREGRVVILERGLPVGESCIVADCNTPWPDQVLHKIKAIQADETVVFATGNVTMFQRGR